MFIAHAKDLQSKSTFDRRHLLMPVAFVSVTEYICDNFVLLLRTMEENLMVDVAGFLFHL